MKRMVSFCAASGVAVLVAISPVTPVHSAPPSSSIHVRQPSFLPVREGQRAGSDAKQESKAKPVPQRVTGRVVDGDGKPVAKAHLAVTGPDEYSTQVWTNADGTFTLSAPEGEYRITVSFQSMLRVFEVEIASGRLSPSELVLK